MRPDNETTCCPQMAFVCGYATCGSKHIMRVVEAMLTATDALPDDLKLFGQALNEIAIQVLTEAFIESLKLYSELGLQERKSDCQITRASGDGVPSFKKHLESVSQTERLHVGRGSAIQSADPDLIGAD